MADESTTGAVSEVAVDNSATAAKSEKLKKTIIKVVIVALVLVAAFWLYKKFVK